MLFSSMLIISSMLILLIRVYGIKNPILHHIFNGYTCLFSLMYYRHGSKEKERHRSKGNL